MTSTNTQWGVSKRTIQRRRRRMEESAVATSRGIESSGTTVTSSFSTTSRINQANGNDCDSIDTPIDSDQQETLRQASLSEGNHKKEPFEIEEGALLAAKLSSKYNLSNECLDDVLKLIQRAKTTEVQFPSSYYKYEKNLQLQNWDVKYHWICECQTTFNWDLFDKPTTNLKCPVCNQNAKANEDHFITFDLPKLLKSTIEKNCNSMFPHTEDGMDFRSSESYKVLNEKGMGSRDITLVLNTDGAPLFSSSKVSFWPVLVQINELTYVKRKRTVIMGGLWIGRDKPKFEPFLQRLLDELTQLQTQGLRWFHSVANKIYSSRIFLLCTLCDSIARPLVQCTSQFNGSYGCPYCLHKEPLWYFSHLSSSAAKRNHNQHVQHCQIATNGRQASLSENSYGVKGFSPLYRLKYFDLVLGFPPDIMHAVYLGVTRQLMKVWLADGLKFLSVTAQQKVNTYLEGIKPPYRVSRVPRPLNLHKEYKAHEWSMWLYYYSPFILQDILPTEFYVHWMCLVIGLSNLTCRKLNETKIAKASEYLERFSKDMEVLYGHSNCTFNVHLLTHLADFAKHYGPLQHICMFSFEDFNSSIMTFVKGTQYVSSQVAKRYLQQILSGSNEREILNVEVPEVLNQFPTTFSEEVQVMLSFRYTLEEITSAKAYKRVKFRQRMFHSTSYGRVSKRNSSVIFIKNESKAVEIEYFMCIGNNCDIICIGTVHELKSCSGSLISELDYVYESKRSYKYFVDLCDVKSIALVIDYESNKYFMNFLNDVENFKE